MLVPMMTLVLIGLLGVVVLAGGSAVSLAVLRVVIRYYLEDDGVRVTFLSFTMWFSPWKDIRDVRVVSGWQILRPSLTCRMGNKLLGPGVEIKKRFGGVVITPNDPEQFAREVKRRAHLR
jgi:hypothetical protein